MNRPKNNHRMDPKSTEQAPESNVHRTPQTSYTSEPRATVDETDSDKTHPDVRRTATVYDAVAGRIGLNGFLRADQLHSNQVQPSTAEEVLLRRVNAPEQIAYDYYNADERLTKSQKLPDSDLLKEIHAFVADYYEATDVDRDGIDFKSFDETALLAMGILLEETCKEALGENGDMVFSEAVSYGQRLPQSRMTQHQIVGRVIPKKVVEYVSETDEDEDEGEGDRDDRDTQAKKRARRRYGNIEGV